MYLPKITQSFFIIILIDYWWTSWWKLSSVFLSELEATGYTETFYVELFLVSLPVASSLRVFILKNALLQTWMCLGSLRSTSGSRKQCVCAAPWPRTQRRLVSSDMLKEECVLEILGSLLSALNSITFRNLMVNVSSPLLYKIYQTMYISCIE